MTELENLLNRLIEKGNNYWFGKRTKEIHIFGNEISMIQYNEHKNDFEENRHSLRDLVSLESGLRQFVCEKGLYKPLNRFIMDNLNDIEINTYTETDYEYRLILSSIQPNLEQFILSNVKLPDGE